MLNLVHCIDRVDSRVWWMKFVSLFVLLKATFLVLNCRHRLNASAVHLRSPVIRNFSLRILNGWQKSRIKLVPPGKTAIWMPFCGFWFFGWSWFHFAAQRSQACELCCSPFGVALLFVLKRGKLRGVLIKGNLSPSFNVNMKWDTHPWLADTSCLDALD